MNILLIITIGAFALILAGRTDPFWIAKGFRQDDSNPPPSVRYADGSDYVKTPTQVVFAHHCASIAAAGVLMVLLVGFVIVAVSRFAQLKQNAAKNQYLTE